MTPSCTAALELAAALIDVRPGDEVILPSFTFVSTVNPFVRLGATPVFVDIDPATLNMDPAAVERAVTPRTKVICPIHYGGVACDLDRLMDIAEDRGLLVVEDAAQAVNSFLNDRGLGGIGHLGAFSFHSTKNFSCGEGGALCVNDPELLQRAEIVREKGTNRPQFMLGKVDKYEWIDIGSSPIPSELCSAFLAAQLEKMDDITQRRLQIHELYVKELAGLELAGRLRLPIVPDNCRSNYHLFYILLSDQSTRDALLHHLTTCSIQSAFHYSPLHVSPMGQRFGYDRGDLPVTENCSGRLLRLPMYCDLTLPLQQRVVKAIKCFFGPHFP
jgi:dTDP-4-amino-4,6-dideoxygalactose transaminase